MRNLRISIRTAVLAALMTAIVASGVRAETAAPPPATAPRPAPGTKGPAAKPGAAKPVAAKRAPAKPVPTRTLDAVHIEGELDVPEVLFITARDQRRILGFRHARYQRGSAELARRTPLPTHVVVDRRPNRRSEGDDR